MNVFKISKLSGFCRSTRELWSLGRAIQKSSFSSTESADHFVENIKQKLMKALQPEYLDVANESPKHNVPRGSASHIRVTIVTPLFNSKTLVQRHRLVNEVLQEELRGPIHALSIQAISTTEMKDVIEKTESPPCKGGSGL